MRGPRDTRVPCVRRSSRTECAPAGRARRASRRPSRRRSPSRARARSTVPRGTVRRFYAAARRASPICSRLFRPVSSPRASTATAPASITAANTTNTAYGEPKRTGIAPTITGANAPTRRPAPAARPRRSRRRGSRSRSPKVLQLLDVTEAEMRLLGHPAPDALLARGIGVGIEGAGGEPRGRGAGRERAAPHPKPPRSRHRARRRARSAGGAFRHAALPSVFGDAPAKRRGPWRGFAAGGARP